MATFGDSGSGGSFFFDDSGNSQYWDKYGSFPGGTITDVYVYVGGDGANVGVDLLVWNTNTIIINQGATALSGSRAVNGQGWVHVGGLSVYCPPTTDFGIGFWTGGNVVWTGSGGSAYFKRTATPIGAAAYDGTEGFTLHAYVVYTPGNEKVWNGSSWVPNTLKVWDGSTWQAPPLKVWNGSSWVPSS